MSYTEILNEITKFLILSQQIFLNPFKLKIQKMKIKERICTQNLINSNIEIARTTEEGGRTVYIEFALLSSYTLSCFDD